MEERQKGGKREGGRKEGGKNEGRKEDGSRKMSQTVKGINDKRGFEQRGWIEEEEEERRRNGEMGLDELS